MSVCVYVNVHVYAYIPAAAFVRYVPLAITLNGAKYITAPDLMYAKSLRSSSRATSAHRPRHICPKSCHATSAARPRHICPGTLRWSRYYHDKIAVSKVFPVSGPTSGMTTITVDGANFHLTSELQVGGRGIDVLSVCIPTIMYTRANTHTHARTHAFACPQPQSQSLLWSCSCGRLTLSTP
jgi:hypothetical protein